MDNEEIKPLVSVIMGSKSDWETVRVASETLARFGIAHECRVLSAHRTPRELEQYIQSSEKKGVKVYIAAAGGAAHLAGVVAAHTVSPVLGVPIESPSLKGLDSLLSMVQMPGGIPVGTLAIGRAGAVNAALLAVAILATCSPELKELIRVLGAEQAEKVLKEQLPDNLAAAPKA
mgnify:FL=1